jgi:hypothetical protein
LSELTDGALAPSVSLSDKDNPPYDWDTLAAISVNLPILRFSVNAPPEQIGRGYLVIYRQP